MHWNRETVECIMAGGLPTLKPVFLSYSAFESLIEGIKVAVRQGKLDSELRKDPQAVLREFMIQYKMADRTSRQGRLRVVARIS